VFRGKQEHLCRNNLVGEPIVVGQLDTSLGGQGCRRTRLLWMRHSHPQTLPVTGIMCNRSQREAAVIAAKSCVCVCVCVCLRGAAATGTKSYSHRLKSTPNDIVNELCA